jgi:hypothetical protein
MICQLCCLRPTVSRATCATAGDSRAPEGVILFIVAVVKGKRHLKLFEAESSDTFGSITCQFRCSDGGDWEVRG